MKLKRKVGSPILDGIFGSAHVSTEISIAKMRILHDPLVVLETPRFTPVFHFYMLLLVGDKPLLIQTSFYFPEHMEPTRPDELARGEQIDMDRPELPNASGATSS